MNERRALVLSPAAIFPVSLFFVMGLALATGDLREALVAPFSALFITVVGYPTAILVWWPVWQGLKKTGHDGTPAILAAAVLAAEAVFWIVLSPVWRRDFSNLFCAVLIAACGLACGLAFAKLAGRAWPGTERPPRGGNSARD
jgi:Kef-type K+ transport system membrane component KefB